MRPKGQFCFVLTLSLRSHAFTTDSTAITAIVCSKLQRDTEIGDGRVGCEGEG